MGNYVQSFIEEEEREQYVKGKLSQEEITEAILNMDCFKEVEKKEMEHAKGKIPSRFPGTEI